MLRSGRCGYVPISRLAPSFREPDTSRAMSPVRPTTSTTRAEAQLTDRVSLPGGPALPPPREPMIQRSEPIAALPNALDRPKGRCRREASSKYVRLPAIAQPRRCWTAEKSVPSIGRTPALPHCHLTNSTHRPARHPDGKPSYPEPLAADEVSGDRDIESRAEHSVGQGYGCDLPRCKGRGAAVPGQFM